MIRFRHLASLGIALALLPALAAAQTGLMRGSVVDSDGQPIEGVQVTVTSEELTSYRKTLTTNKKGEFRLRSGLTATTYFDKYLFEADPLLLRSIAAHLRIIVPPDTEVLAGLEPGDRVIVSGQHLLADGTAVAVQGQ